MKNLVWIFIAACIFAACSDDDGPKTPPVEYDVISFEPAEGMLDAVTGQEVKLGEVKMSGCGLGGLYLSEGVLCKSLRTTAV